VQHQLNAQLTPQSGRRAGRGTATQYAVSWLNPSGVWQSIYSGPDGGQAQAAGAEYEAQGYAVDAWVYDDALGWQLQHWSTASTGLVRQPPAPSSSGATWGYIALGAGAVALTGAAIWLSR